MGLLSPFNSKPAVLYAYFGTFWLWKAVGACEAVKKTNQTFRKLYKFCRELDPEVKQAPCVGMDHRFVAGVTCQFYPHPNARGIRIMAFDGLVPNRQLSIAGFAPALSSQTGHLSCSILATSVWVTLAIRRP